MNRLKNETHKGWLMSGAGNTFAIEITDQSLNNLEAKQICEKFKVDGYLGLSLDANKRYKWNFFNSDGSDAEFCGNAARCAQDFLKKNDNSTHSRHQTTAGLVLSWTDQTQNWVMMPRPQVMNATKTLSQDDHNWTGLWCNTGVPHFVLERAKLRHDVWKELSQKLRVHPDFGARGSNITWVKRDADKVMAVTYERGVEDFTQACGTGALAAALWWQSQEPDRKNFDIAMPGGLLQVVSHETGWIMTGPVEKLGDWSI